MKWWPCKGPVKVLVTRHGFARGPELDQRNSTLYVFFCPALSSVQVTTGTRLHNHNMCDTNTLSYKNKNLLHCNPLLYCSHRRTLPFTHISPSISLQTVSPSISPQTYMLGRGFGGWPQDAASANFGTTLAELARPFTLTLLGHQPL